MTSLDWPPPPVDDMVVERLPRRHRHIWLRCALTDGHEAPGVYCHFHGEPVLRDETAYRRGRSARRLGGDQERRIERVYGPVKIGERGDPVDHLGRVWRWQSKATRGLPPTWLAVISRPTPRATIPVELERAYFGMTNTYTDRRSLVIRSFVKQGVLTRDWLFVHHLDAVGELGLPDVPAWYVIPGDWFLDNFGRDE